MSDRDTIIRAIEECTTRHETYFDGRGNVTEIYFDKERFYNLAHAAGAAAERERVILECIDLVAMYGGPVDLEAAIRARGADKKEQT